MEIVNLMRTFWCVIFALFLLRALRCHGKHHRLRFDTMLFIIIHRKKCANILPLFSITNKIEDGWWFVWAAKTENAIYFSSLFFLICFPHNTSKAAWNAAIDNVSINGHSNKEVAIDERIYMFSSSLSDFVKKLPLLILFLLVIKVFIIPFVLTNKISARTCAS